jgi:hypothetical protein
MSDKNNHGGKRDGSGRPSSSARIQHDNKIVERKLKASAELGWEVLAESYPDIMRRAVELAMGSESTTPNITLLRTLLELMVKVSGSEPSSNETVTDALVKGFIEDVRAIKSTEESDSGARNRTRDTESDGGYVQWTDADFKLPGMANRI